MKHIQEVDPSPFYLCEFEYPEQKLRFRKPVTITPELDETGSCFASVIPGWALTFMGLPGMD